MANPKLTVEIEADIDKMKSALQEADNLLEQHQEKYKDVYAAMGQSSQRVRELEKALEEQNKSIADTSAETAKYTQENDRLTKELADAKGEVEQYQKELADLKSEMDKMASATRDHQTATTANAEVMDRAAAETRELVTATAALEQRIETLQNELAENAKISLGYEKAQQELNQELRTGAISAQEFSRANDRLARDEKETAVETRNLRRELAELKRQYRDVSAASVRMGRATGQQNMATQQLARTTDVNAVPAMTSFSQVVQDAPYGIQGVANNIQHLTMQFGYLQKNAGGTTAALKAMAGSLIGPAGVLFAVSVVTSLLVQFGDELFKSGEEAKTAAEKMNDYIDSLEGVQKAQVDARRSAAQELVQLRLLEQQATNTALSMEERTAAIDELRRRYPALLKDMEDERILLHGIRDANDDISESIMRKARAQAAENIMVENYKQEIGYKEELLKLEQDLAEAEQSRDRLLASAEDAITFAQRSEWLKAAAKQEENINDIYDRRKEIQDEITKATEENTRLEQYVAEGGNLPIAPDYIEVDPSNAEVSTLEPIRVPIESVFEAGVVSTDDDLDIAIKRQIAELKRLQSVFPETAEGYRLIQAEIERLELRVAPLGEKLTAPLLQVRPVMQSTVDASKEMADEVSQAARQADRAFQGMVSGMINSMIRGEFKVEDFVKNVLSSLASIAITSMLGPAGGIFGGLFSQGGVVPKRGLAGSFSNGGMVVPGSSNVGDKLLAFVNSGELILNKNQQKALYSALNTPTMVPVMNDEAIPIKGTTRIDGQDLMIVYERADRQRNRRS